MKVCMHAIRRYKKRLGSKTASKQRITRKIQTAIRSHSKRRYIHKNHLYVETPTFTAVCYKGMVITILLPEEKYNPKEYQDELSQMHDRDAQ